MVFAVTFLATAKAADNCRPATRGPSWAEWFENDKLRGARFVFEPPWEETGTNHGQWLGYEPYPRNVPITGWLWLGVAFTPGNLGLQRKRPRAWRRSFSPN
jgi:hypothetical protein